MQSNLTVNRHKERLQNFLINKMEVYLNNEGCNAKMCKSCIFRTDGKALKLNADRMSEIQTYLIQGQRHMCHVTDETCYGALNYQATIFYRLGMIPQESVECLLETAKNWIKE